MLDIRLLTADSYGKFENLYEDFRKRAANEYNFELEPLDYDGFLEAIDKDLIKCIVLMMIIQRLQHFWFIQQQSQKQLN